MPDSTSLQWTTRGRAHVLADDVPHDGGVMAFDKVIGRVTDPAVLIPLLFAEIDATLAQRLRPGDFIVAGRNFLSGKAHNNGLIAMKALGLRVLCESMPLRAYQAVAGVALPCLADCPGITGFVNDGDEIEVDMLAGSVRNLRSGQLRQVAPMPEAVRALIEHGGTRGLLARHLQAHPELGEPFAAALRAPAAGSVG